MDLRQTIIMASGAALILIGLILIIFQMVRRWSRAMFNLHAEMPTLRKAGRLRGRALLSVLVLSAELAGIFLDFRMKWQFNEPRKKRKAPSC